jgi:hypothetical protein
MSTPVAPVVGAQGQKTVHGGHYTAYRAQSAFAPTATLKLISGSNPWRPNTPGHTFYTAVLSKAPATVSAALELGAKVGFKASASQAHLRWLYTWGGSYVQIDGKVFSPPVVPVAPKAEKAKAPKAKTPAKV